MNIFSHIENDDVQTLKILIVGPDDSPYHGGFFLFKVNFPSDFPFSPPIVKFITAIHHQGCRLHPNLYQEGKVCLSILNTWGNNEWSPALTLEKVFLTIQGLLDSNPIANEPGYHTRTLKSPEAQSYYQVALYRTLKVAVLDMFVHPLLPVEFKNVMTKYFKEHRDDYLKQIDKLAIVDKTQIKCFHGYEFVDYNQLKKSLIEFNPV